MTIFLRGFVRSDFEILSGDSLVSRSGDGHGPYAMDGVRLMPGAPGGRVRGNFDSVLSDFWLTCYSQLFSNSTPSGYWNAGTDFLVFTSGGVNVLRLAPSVSADGHLDLEAWDGAAWVFLAKSTTARGSNAELRMDIKVVLSDTVGVFELYYDKVLALTYSGDTIRGVPTTIDGAELDRGTTSTGGLATVHWGAMVVADEDTREFRVVQSLSNNLSRFNEFAGSVNSAWEQEIFRDGVTEAFAETAGLTQTMNFNAASTIYDVGWSILSVGYRINTRQVGSGLNVKIVAQSADLTVYEGALFTPPTNDAYDLGTTGVDFDINPNTLAPWASRTEVETFYAGLRTF